MKLFFVNNDTQAYVHTIDSDLMSKVADFCRNNQVFPADLLFYTCSLTAAILNGNTKNTLPLSICNCRITQEEKNCAGTKAQSIPCYTKFNYEKTFEENARLFAAKKAKTYMHLDFPDVKFESMLHQTYRSSFFEMYYSMAYVKLAKLWERNERNALAYHRKYYEKKLSDTSIYNLHDVYVDITGKKETYKRFK